MKKIIILTILLMLLPSAAALECQFDATPFIDTDFSIPFVPDKWQFLQDKIYWQCLSNMSEYSCVSTIQNDNANGTVVQVNPIPSDLQDVGRIDTFESDGRVATISFRAETNTIRAGQNYTFNVFCGNGTQQELFSAQVSPIYRELDAPLALFAGNIKNVPFFVVAIIVISFLIALVLWTWKHTKE